MALPRKMKQDTFTQNFANYMQLKHLSHAQKPGKWRCPACPALAEIELGPKQTSRTTWQAQGRPGQHHGEVHHHQGEVVTSIQNVLVTQT